MIPKLKRLRPILLGVVLIAGGDAATRRALCQEATVVALEVSPAAAPRPALRYRLLPEAAELVRGNAATLYFRAMMYEGSAFYLSKNLTPIAELLDKPASAVTEAAMVEALKPFGSMGMFDDIQAATYRANCDWEDRLETGGAIKILATIQQQRELGRIIALRARLDIRQGKLEDALTHLSQLVTLGRNTARGGGLIHALVSAAIVRMGVGPLEEFIAAKDSPNLYWALTAIPQPPNWTANHSVERKLIAATILLLGEIEKRAFSPAETAKLVDQLGEAMYYTEPTYWGRPESIAFRFALAGWVIKNHPDALQYLERQGFSDALLEEMPAIQVVTLYRYLQYKAIQDDVDKWLFLEANENRSGRLEEAERQLAEYRRRGDGMPFTAAIWWPQQEQSTRIREHTNFAALRTVEAMRMYAAAKGRWPDRLDEIAAVPVPVNPATGEAFGYRLEGGVAILRVRTSVSVDVNKEYRLTLRSATAGGPQKSE